MVINHNISALNTYNQLTKNEKAQASSLQKLSSGLRINSAADDAAGLAISQKMQAQINGLDQASRNAQDGISLVQTAEGSLSETQSILQRMRTLAVQSANDTNGSDDRSAITQEVTQLKSEIDRIASDTQFNKKNLLDGSAGVAISGDTKVSNLTGTADTQAGAITANIASLATKGAVTGGENSFVDATANFTQASTIGIAGKTYSFTATDTVQDALDAINADSAASGVTASYANAAGFTFTAVSAGSSYGVNITAAATGDFNADTAVGVQNTKGADAVVTIAGSSIETNGNHVSVLSGASKGMEFDAVTTGASAITVSTNNSLKLQIGSDAGQNLSIAINNMDATALGVAGIDVSTQANADSAITVLDNAITKVSTERAKLGAVQNRLDHTINNLGVESQNLTSASSAITDVDMAKEMMTYTKNNILNQAAQAMLAQANQLPQGVLQLLK